MVDWLPNKIEIEIEIENATPNLCCSYMYTVGPTAWQAISLWQYATSLSHY